MTSCITRYLCQLLNLSSVRFSVLFSNAGAGAGILKTIPLVCSWFPVGLCTSGRMQGWRRKQGLFPFCLLVFLVIITIATLLHSSSSSNFFLWQQLIQIVFVPIFVEPALRWNLRVYTVLALAYTSLPKLTVLFSSRVPWCPVGSLASAKMGICLPWILTHAKQQGYSHLYQTMPV